MCRTADNAPASTAMAVESIMQAHFDNGLEEYSLYGLSTHFITFMTVSIVSSRRTNVFPKA
eukprot:2277252-Pleurochrysis_carterae.AAC.2